MEDNLTDVKKKEKMVVAPAFLKQIKIAKKILVIRTTTKNKSEKIHYVM